MTPARKTSVVGTGISLTSYDGVLETLDDRPADRALTIAICNVHSVMSARSDADLATALAETDIATPDGVPLVWALRWTGEPTQARVAGPDLMKLALLEGDRNGWTHYLYGSTEETLTALEETVARFSPVPQIVGSFSPPFRPMSEDEEAAALDGIRNSGADIVWIGLGMPKQELWMQSVRERLPGVALVGVGAAFDFLAGTVKRAPVWMQRSGLEWLYRLAQEPRRLWRRYLWNNPAYLMLLARQVARHRFGSRFPTADKSQRV